MASIQVDETLSLIRVDNSRPLTSLICAAIVDKAALVLGTADGFIHIAHVDGPTRTYSLRAFDGLQRRSPITTIRTCGGLIFFMQSPSDRILQIEKSFDETVKFISFQNDAILSFDIDHSGLLIAGDAKGCVFSWNLLEDRPVAVIHSEDEPIAAVALESNQQLAVFATGNGRIIGYDMKANIVLASVEYKFDAIMAGAWYRHHGGIVADSSGQVLAIVVNETRFEKVHEWTEEMVVVTIAVHRSGQYVALGMRNGHVIVRSLQDPAVILGEHCMNSAVIAVEFVDQNEKSPRLLVASYCGSLEIWPVSISDVSEDDNFTDVISAQGHESTLMVEDRMLTVSSESRTVQTDDFESCDLIIDGEIPICSASLPEVPKDEKLSDSVSFMNSIENSQADVDDLMQPRSGPVPTPEPPVPVNKEGQSENFNTLSHTLPEVGLTNMASIDNELEPRNIIVVPKPMEPCHSLAVTPSIPVGRFSSKKKIDAVLSRSGRLSSDSVLATPSLNSTSWIQYQIDQLATSALAEPPDIDVRVVTERAACKALYVDPTKTGIFGKLPSIEVELPPPSRPQIQKQVDPKWVRSLDRKPVLDASLNREDLEPQIPGHDLNWSLTSSTHQRPYADNPNVTVKMGTLLMQRMSYWQRGFI